VAGSRLAAFPLVAMLCGLGLALAGCGASSPAASQTAAAATTATATATASAATATAGAATPTAASGKPACPSAAAVSAAAGTAYLPPTVKSAGGTLSCSYEANSGFLLISFAKASFPPSALQQVADSQALAQGGLKASPVSGLGDAADLFTSKGTGTGPATSELLLVSGSRAITIVAAGNAGQIKAIARLAIAS
jgi:hypothetical protein